MNMRLAAIILGVVLIGIGGLMASGALKYQDTDKVVDFGKVEIEATREKTAPVNWGYVLLGGGLVVLIGGALMRKGA